MVAVVRMAESDTLHQVAEAILAGGVSHIEVTMTTPGALQVIEQLRKKGPAGMVVGVGSVCDAETARRAISAGAQYVVSPVFKPEIIAAAHAHDVPAATGCFTPTEIQLAWEAGADLIKVFPADVVGMAFFKAVLAPLPHLKLMPTGGVTLDNGGDWIRAGAVAVGVGSALLDKKAIADGNFGRLTDNASRLVASVNSAR